MQILVCCLHRLHNCFCQACNNDRPFESAICHISIQMPLQQMPLQPSKQQQTGACLLD